MMILKDIVSKTNKPVTKNDLIKGLKELGVENTELLMVYSNLKSFNFLCFYCIIIYIIKKATNYKNWKNLF